MVHPRTFWRLTVLAAALTGTVPFAPAEADQDAQARTPIRHVLLLIGENRSFDQVFGTFVAPPWPDRPRPAVGRDC